MKTLITLVALLGLAGAALGQARVDIHATECVPLQDEASCVLMPHTFPDGEAVGVIWAQDCAHTAVQGFTCPFKWPPNTIVESSVGGNLDVTLAVRANFPAGDGEATTGVCHEVNVTCREWPDDLGTDTGSDGKEQREVFMLTGGWSDVSTTFTVRNTDEVSFLHKLFGVQHDAAGAPGADCELKVRRKVSGGACDETSATIGYETFLLEFGPAE